MDVCFWDCELNQVADSISKSYDREDYECTLTFFNYVQTEFDIKCNVDRFANNLNTKCLVFNSLVQCLGTSGIDCFKYNWGKPYINWLFPPPRLVSKTIFHLMASHGEGLLLCPQWYSANYYPILCSLKIENAKCLVFDGKNVFRKNSDPTTFFDENFACNITVWHLKF